MNRTIAGLFIILLAGAVFFSLERILFADASFILTRIINTGTLQIQEHRYGSFITQGFPLVASYLDLPLSTIVVLYSLSFNLFYLLIAFLLLYKFKEHGLAMLMSFYYLLFVSDSYFWTNNEVHQGIAWMFLFFGLITAMHRNKSPRLLFIPVFAFFAFLAIFTHPLVLFPTLFLWTFFIIERKWDFNFYEILMYSLLLTGICMARYLLSTHASHSHYDIEKLQFTNTISLKGVMEALSSPLAKEIVKRTINNYWILPLLFITGLVSALHQKKYLAVLLTMAFGMAYLIAICLTFQEFQPFYMESELMALSIIATALFVYHTVPTLQSKHVVIILMVIYLVRLGYIAHASQKWVERKEWIMARLDDMRKKGINKGLIYENEENRKILIMNWGLPQETLVASALQGDKPQLTLVTGTMENLNARIPENKNKAIGSFEIFDNSIMNKNYFIIDTNSLYQVLEP